MLCYIICCYVIGTYNSDTGVVHVYSISSKGRENLGQRLLNVTMSSKLRGSRNSCVLRLYSMMCYGLPGRRRRTTIAHFGFSALGRFRLVQCAPWRP